MDMKNLILQWYDEMIRINEENENYEACSYFKTSKDAYLKFNDEGSILYKGKRYTPTEVLSLIKEERENKDIRRLKGVKG